MDDTVLLGNKTAQWNSSISFNSNKDETLCKERVQSKMLIGETLGTIIWLSALMLITILNIVILYGSLQFRMLRQNALHRIVISNYVANLIFGISMCTTVLISPKEVTCTHLVIVYCFVIAGGTAEILGAMALSIMRYRQVLKIEVNNTIIKRDIGSQKKRQAQFHLCYIWIFSLVVTIAPIIIDRDEVLAVPYITGAFSIVITVIICLKTYFIIKRQRQQIRQSSLHSYSRSLLRTERIILSCIIILIVAWIPTQTARILIHLTPITINEYVIHILYQVSVLYPILHPVLCVIRTKQLKRYFTTCCKKKKKKKQSEKLKGKSLPANPFVITKMENSTTY